MGLTEPHILFKPSELMRVTDVQRGSPTEFDGVDISIPWVYHRVNSGHLIQTQINLLEHRQISPIPMLPQFSPERMSSADYQ